MEHQEEFEQVLHALALALPCVEYAEIETAAQGLDGAHKKCCEALTNMRALLNRHGVLKPTSLERARELAINSGLKIRPFGK